MPEISYDASFLIAISYQALYRINNAGKEILIDNAAKPCDALVTVVFLGFYLEASINKLIELLEVSSDLKTFYKPNSWPGIRDKYAWFYNRYMEEKKVTEKSMLYKPTNRIDNKLEATFPGFKEICKFRNSIAHGDLHKAIALVKSNYNDTVKVQKLRTQAKDIVYALVEIANGESKKDLRKNMSYDMALLNFLQP